MSSKSSAARRSTLRSAVAMYPTLRLAQPGQPVPRGLAHRVAAEADRVFASGAQADVAGHVPQELVRVELATQALDVRAVLTQRGDARIDRSGDVRVVSR